MTPLLLAVLCVSPAEANARGMKWYQAKKYTEASAEFRRALSLESTPQPSLKEETAHRKAIALAHFNLACSLALQRKAGRVCEDQAYRSTIWQHVRASIALDPARLEKALVDTDLALVRDSLVYQSLLGRSPSRETDLPAILEGVTWWTGGQGVHGSLHELKFGPSEVTLTSIVFDADGNRQSKRNVLKGTWVASGRGITLSFSTAPPGLSESRLQGTLSADGTFEIKELGVLRDEPSECDA